MLLLTWESILSSGPPSSSGESSPPSSARPEAEEANISIMNAEAAAKFGDEGSILKNLHPPRFHHTIPLDQRTIVFCTFPPLFRM